MRSNFLTQLNMDHLLSTINIFIFIFIFLARHLVDLVGRAAPPRVGPAHDAGQRVIKNIGKRLPFPINFKKMFLLLFDFSAVSARVDNLMRSTRALSETRMLSDPVRVNK